MSTIVKKKLQINGMHCSSCAMNIDFALEDVSGIKFAKTSYAKQEAEVEFDEEKTSVKEIISHIKKVGYDSKPL